VTNSCVDTVNKNWLPWLCHLRDRKNNFISFIFGRASSTNPANKVKSGPVDAKIIGLTEIVKILQNSSIL